MRILIVDDEYYSVKAIQELVNWENLTDEPVEVFAAYNGIGAREIIQNENIDIMLCDIEMPRESGIELITWVRSQKLPMEILIITCHSSFSYAREAINLQVFDYCVKPLDFRELEAILKKLIEKIKQQRDMRIKSRYGNYWVESRPMLEEQFWKNVLTNSDENIREAIREEAGKIGLHLSEEPIYHVILVQMKMFRVRFVKWNQEKIYRSVANVAKEILEGTMESQRIILIGSFLFVVAENRQEDWLKKKCQELIEVCREMFKLQIACYVEYPVSYWNLAESYTKLCHQAFERVGQTGDLFLVSEDIPDMPVRQKTVAVTEKIPKEILEFLKKGQFLDYEREAHYWLCKLEQEKSLTRENLEAIQEDFQQAIYHYLMERGISASVLRDEEVRQTWFEACDSIDALETWIRLMNDRIRNEQEKVRRRSEGTGVMVREMKTYMEEHLNQELTREEIARVVHVHPDYANRIFKKEEGDSIMDYLMKRRVTRAVKLMDTTQKSMSEIAAMTGFVNAAHFSTTFKRIIGCSPSQYKSRNEKKTSR